MTEREHKPLPEVIGWEVEEAKARLRPFLAEDTLEIRETSSGRPSRPGDLRVIRQKLSAEGKVELTVAAFPQIPQISALSSQIATLNAQRSTQDSEPSTPTRSEADGLNPEQGLLSRLDLSRVPKHIALIMDGNGRWAEQRGLPRFMGHQAGLESAKAVVRACSDLGIRFVTLYSFSAENWTRPKEEVATLMELIRASLQQELPDMHAEGVRVRLLGRRGGLSAEVREAFEQAEEQTRDNSGLTLNVAANYSGRWEIVDAARRLAEQVKTGALTAEAIDEETFAAALYLPDTPDPELLIRTSGEMRVSNYLLWQIAYSEIYVTPVLWPDFRRIHLLEALVDYQQRHRRFGAVG